MRVRGRAVLTFLEAPDSRFVILSKEGNALIA